MKKLKVVKRKPAAPPVMKHIPPEVLLAKRPFNLEWQFRLDDPKNSQNKAVNFTIQTPWTPEELQACCNGQGNTASYKLMCELLKQVLPQ